MQENHKIMRIEVSNGTLARIFVFGLLILALYKLIDVVLILLTAIVVASFVESGVKKFRKFIPNRTLLVILIYVLVFGLITILASIFIPIFIKEISTLVVALKNYIPVDSVLNTFNPDTLTDAKGVVKNLSKNASLSDVVKSTQNLVNGLSGNFVDIVSSAFGGALNLILIFIISFYLSITERGIENFLAIVTPDKYEKYVIGLWQRTEHKIGLWMQGQMILGLVIGILTYIILLILGVQYAFVLALITAFFELIPFGIFLAFIPAMVFGYLDGGVTMAVLIFLLYFGLHQVENYLIAPWIIKKVVGISPLVIILATLVGATLAGFWGVVLAIPCAVCLLEFMNDLEEKKALTRK